MTAPPAGAQLSEDGQWWWDADANEWQPAAAVSSEGQGAGSYSDAAGQAGEAGAAGAAAGAAGADAGQAATPVAVHHSVTLVAQPTEQSCWAASIAMLTNETPDAVVEKAGLSLSEGYGWDQIEPAARANGLGELAPACGGPEVLAGWLQNNGPLWVVEVGAPYHAVVVAGVEGDGTWENSHVTVYNPWPPGSGAVQQVPFSQFENDFELGAGARAAILHR